MTLILFAVSAAVLIFSAECVQVKLEQGKLKGKTCVGIKNDTFYSFLKVPYAKPPVGDLRFKAPVEAEPWKGVLDASTHDLPYCAQVRLHKAAGEEDCLYLNVHTPHIPKKEDGNNNLLPVLLFIHGGGFLESSGSANNRGAEYLMHKNVVFVTINYRLGLFGFISSNNSNIDVPGNSGLKDQNMALRWVNKNIKHFGGDPNNVMVFGESAGGVSAHMHMLSPLSRGLCHKIGAMSGTAAHQWGLGKVGTFEAKAKLLGVYNDDAEKMLEDMQSLSTEEILKTQRQDGFMIPIHEPFECSPVVERPSPNAFLSEDPLTTISKGNYSRLPLMLGYTSVDGLVYQVVERLHNRKPFYPTDYSKLIPYDFIVNEQQLKEFENNVKRFYYGGEDPSEKNLDATTNVVTDVWFISGLVRLLNKMKDFDGVYFYRFSADTKLNFMKTRTPETANVPGTCHGDELGYIMKTANSAKIEPGSIEEQVMDSTVKLFTNFAKTGKPTLENDAVQWLPVTKDEFNYMEIGNTLTPGVNPDKERFYFWQRMYKKYCTIA